MELPQLLFILSNSSVLYFLTLPSVQPRRSPAGDYPVRGADLVPGATRLQQVSRHQNME